MVDLVHSRLYGIDHMLVLHSTELLNWQPVTAPMSLFVVLMVDAPAPVCGSSTIACCPQDGDAFRIQCWSICFLLYVLHRSLPEC